VEHVALFDDVLVALGPLLKLEACREHDGYRTSAALETAARLPNLLALDLAAAPI
jgi:hypothetical protein